MDTLDHQIVLLDRSTLIRFEIQDRGVGAVLRPAPPVFLQRGGGGEVD